jgi:3-isopropylmalate/(R)-2-methylmalate dehydratase large subunit
MSARTLYDKLVAGHTVTRLDEQNVLLYADLHIMNEYTSPQAFAGLRERGIGVAVPGQNVAVVDHIIPTHPVRYRVIQDRDSALQATNLKRNCDEHAIPLFDTNDPLQGIEHVIAPELGMIRPGMVVLCGDSHTTTYGALGALGFGIGTSEVEQLLATQTLVYRLAQNMRIHVAGRLSLGCTSKDLILHIINRIGAQGARGYVVEFTGEAITSLSIEARMTLCNMAVEAGARGALIAPDQLAIDYVSARAPDLREHLPQAIALWQQLRSDEDARFDAELRFDATQVSPRVTWGTSPDQSIAIDALVPDPAASISPQQRSAVEKALHYMDLTPGAAIEGLAIDRVFIGSCTNARIEDLQAVAKVVGNRKVNSRIRAMVVPGSGAVKQQAEEEGIAALLVAAGFEWRQPGCSMCLAMNDDVLQPGERCASTTNRNFEGRQGRAGRTHLMSPAMAAAAALTGYITDVRRLESDDVR